jgi:predicted enzyme related to lactoylglutathione lyase
MTATARGHNDRNGRIRRPRNKGGSVERVTGIGGLFFRASDPDALGRWYEDHLGVKRPPTDSSGSPWVQEAGPTVFSPFARDTDYFGRPENQWMANFRVRDLDAMLAQLREAGAEIVGEVQTMEGVGRFGWATDPEGNRIELWEPDPAALAQLSA